MSCHCNGRGIIRVCYHDGAPTMFGLCLCQAGLAWRNDQNAGRQTYPLWQVWAAQQQVAHDQIAFIEELLDPEEITEMFPDYKPGRATVEGTQAAIIAAARPGKL